MIMRKMKRLLLILVVLTAIVGAGCPQPAANSANNTKGAPSATVAVNTPAANRPMNSFANSKPADKKGGAPKFTPKATAPVSTSEKKDEGLFSFPPPKVTDVFDINTADLVNREGQTTLSQISAKLAAALERADYRKGNYIYFWNDQDEFAVVTEMERVNADGTKFETSERWDKSKAFPQAGSIGEYFKYLIKGKKVFYRVFAFVVTSSRKRQSFMQGTPPDFMTASKWSRSAAGSDELGDGETTTIQDVIFSEKYKCFALLYLFVNHTSLDDPKAIDLDDDFDIRDLIKGLNTQAEQHLKNTNIRFGE
jgi:hypothetical protein